MSSTLAITLAQINPIVGDLAGNRARIEEIWRATEADLIVFPELSLCGYSPEDLVTKPSFLDAVDNHLKKLIAASLDHPSAILIGAPFRQNNKIFNAAHLIFKGEITTVRKHHLPNYNVFDEARIFSPAPIPEPVTFKGQKLGIIICEDMWYPHVAHHLAQSGAELLIVINASPYEAGKHARRLAAARDCIAAAMLPLIYVHHIGGQDEVVYDGASFALDASGKLIVQAAQFQEEILPITWKNKNIKPLPDQPTADYAALKLGLHDYVTKNGFTGVLLGLSGGIDSALTATIAVDALGANAVHGILLPSRYTSEESLNDAATLAKNLGISLQNFPISMAVDTFEKTLEPFFAKQPDNLTMDLTHQNIQPRVRGTILMALSNATSRLLLTTGNKSELAMGYATLYGDMCGGFNPIKDVYKTYVYELARWRNLAIAGHPRKLHHARTDRRTQTRPDGSRHVTALRNTRRYFARFARRKSWTRRHHRARP